MKIQRVIWLVVLTSVTAMTVHAELTDKMDTTENFSAGFGGTVAQAKDGVVEIIRKQGGVDAGIDWLRGGKEPLSVESEKYVVIVPNKSINFGSYIVNIQFFDENGDFTEEVEWIPETTSTKKQFVDVTTLATKDESQKFRLRIRVVSLEDEGFAFDGIHAGSKPIKIEKSTAADSNKPATSTPN